MTEKGRLEPAVDVTGGGGPPSVLVKGWMFEGEGVEVVELEKEEEEEEELVEEDEVFANGAFPSATVTFPGEAGVVSLAMGAFETLD